MLLNQKAQNNLIFEWLENFELCCQLFHHQFANPASLKHCELIHSRRRVIFWMQSISVIGIFHK